jgi:uncharacterized protein (TIGR03437 family)
LVAHSRVGGDRLSGMRLAWLAFVGTLHAVTFFNPPPVSYSTYLPGGGASYSGIDGTGALYFSGQSSAPCSLPPSSLQTTTKIYGTISKLQPAGDTIAWTACLPGDVAGLVVASDGSIYVANSDYTYGYGSEGSYLVPLSSTVTKLAPNAATVVYSTSIPSAKATTIAADSAGNIYVAGEAGPGLPTTPGANMPSLNCSSSTTTTCVGGFLAKLDQKGAIQFATYHPYAANGIAVDSHGAIWITGTVIGQSTPVSPVSYDGETETSAITKFDSYGKPLFDKRFGSVYGYAIQVPGIGVGIVVDADDAAYAIGSGTDVPTTSGTLQPDGDLEASVPYIIKLDSSGNLVYGTYLDSPASAVSVDAAGNAYLGLNGQQRPSNVTYNPNTCGWVLGTMLAVISPDATKIVASQILPGWITSISQDEDGRAYVAGSAAATAFVATPGAYETQYPVGPSAPTWAAKVDFSQPQGPALGCLANAASGWAGRTGDYASGAVAPGELVSLFGQGFRPGPDLNVTFDGKPVPILYADTGQINAVAPFQAGADSSFTMVSVNQGTQVIGPYQLPVAPAAPGIFAASINGKTQAAALNEDGSINSSTNPAAPGSVVSVFTTGAGAYSPAIGDGDLGPMQPPFPVPTIGVSARIGPTLAEPFPLLFAGQAPGLIAGVVQLNLGVPADVPPGPANFAAYFGPYPTPTQVIFVGGR